MILLDEIFVPSRDGPRRIGLYAGDLAAIPSEETVDILVVSAFPGDYATTATSLIGALQRRKGLSVAALAERKAVDLREFSACWLSEEVNQAALGFRRILCFEPAFRGSPPEVVGDVFRSIVPFLSGNPPLKSLAMPVLASGDQGNSPSRMLRSMLEASFHWLGIGLPLECIKIVGFGDNWQLDLYGEVFAEFKSRTATFQPPPPPQRWKYDAFISYSHRDTGIVDHFRMQLTHARPSIRLFVDRLALQPGAAWQQQLFEVIDDCAKVIPFLSPDYLDSKICKEEYNIAYYRHRDSDTGVLVPVYLRSAQLPTYMKVTQWIDCREADVDKIGAAARQAETQL
jgi:hypothetical protein